MRNLAPSNQLQLIIHFVESLAYGLSFRTYRSWRGRGPLLGLWRSHYGTHRWFMMCARSSHLGYKGHLCSKEPWTWHQRPSISLHPKLFNSTIAFQSKPQNQCTSLLAQDWPLEHEQFPICNIHTSTIPDSKEPNCFIIPIQLTPNSEVLQESNFDSPRLKLHEYWTMGSKISWIRKDDKSNQAHDKIPRKRIKPTLQNPQIDP